MATVATQVLPQALSLDLLKQSVVNVKSVSVLAAALPSLRSRLSEGAVIYLPHDEAYESSTKRFSGHQSVLPGAVVCVAQEQDIATTVRWACANNVKFFAQTGRHSWMMALPAIGPQGIVIDLRAVNQVNINKQDGTAVLGAGTTTGDVLKAAQNASCHIVTAANDGVGAVSSIMGGGLGHLVSNFGLGADSILSARLVTANGSVVTVSPTQNPDLFWALRGTGHNFGIVSELTVKTHPLINHGQQWSGMLGFPGSKETVTKVLQTIEDLGITQGQGPEGMSCTVVYGRPSPSFEATILLKLSFNGPAAAAMSAFAPLYDLIKAIVPSVNESKSLPADQTNEFKDLLCSEGGSLTHALRPVHTASLTTLDIATMGELYQRWENFTREHPGTEETIIKISCYDYRHVRSIPAKETAFGWRQNPIQVWQYWSYNDPSLSSEIRQLGAEFREALTGGKDASVIMNFASGDESPETIHGENLERLRALKKVWDPKGAFSTYGL